MRKESTVIFVLALLISAGPIGALSYLRQVKTTGSTKLFSAPPASQTEPRPAQQGTTQQQAQTSSNKPHHGNKSPAAPTPLSNDGLVTTAAFRILNESSNSSRTSVRINVTKFFLEELDNDCSLHEGAVSTRLNLNSKVFVDITMGIGIDPSPYETKFNWIDTELLKSRNEIAHGKWLNFDERSFSDFADMLLGLVRQFKNDPLNAAVLGLYKRP